jgi:hypothetical protein
VKPVSFDGAGAGTVVHLVSEAGDELITGVSPQVRPAKEREGELAAHVRPFLMLRRSPGDAGSRFAAVLTADGAGGRAKSVTRLPTTGGGIALLVRGERFSDLLALDARDLRAEHDGQSLHADGEFSLVRLSKSDGFVYTTGRASYGELTAEAAATGTGRVLRAAEHDGGGRFVLDAAGSSTVPAVGETLLLEHGGDGAQGYTVLRAERSGDTLEVLTREPPGFLLEDGGMRFERFPGTSHTGPVRAKWQRPASMTGRP